MTIYPEDHKARSLFDSEGNEVFADVHCPRCNEMVNVRCWKCDWQRPPGEREDELRMAANGMWDHKRGAPIAEHPWVNPRNSRLGRHSKEEGFNRGQFWVPATGLRGMPEIFISGLSTWKPNFENLTPAPIIGIDHHVGHGRDYEFRPWYSDPELNRMRVRR